MDPIGKIEVIIGPMYSGKTTELMRRINRLKFTKKKIIEVRYGDDLIDITHDNNQKRGKKIKLLSEVYNEVIDCGYNVIAIDEGQFILDLVEYCETFANKYNMIVLVAGLDCDYKRNPFQNICNLIAKAESVTKLTAICCLCGSENGSFSHRIVNENKIELIGTMYKACCRKCYFILESEKLKHIPDHQNNYVPNK